MSKHYLIAVEGEDYREKGVNDMCSCNGTGKVFSSPFPGAWLFESCTCEVGVMEQKKRAQEWEDFQTRLKEAEMKFGGVKYEQRVI